MQWCSLIRPSTVRGCPVRRSNLKNSVGLLLFCLVLNVSAQERERDLRNFLGLGAPPDEAAAKLGEPLYKQNCAACHGENARGAQGPNLVRSPLVLHDEKGKEILPIVQNGRPAEGMPAFPKLSREEVYNIAEYIHLEIEKAANRGLYNNIYAQRRKQTSGNATKGKAFFAGHCVSCHSAEGDLNKIGAKYPEAATMQARFIWPASHASPTVRVTTKSGAKVEGTVLQLDDFEVKVRDAQGASHEWSRDDVAVEVEDKLDGHRALLPKYTDDDLHNVTAYLLELK